MKPVKPVSEPSGQTYRGGGDDLLSDHPQGVHHRDVAQPAGNPQSCVTVLDRESIVSSAGRARSVELLI